ncbi:metalloprotease [Rhizobium sp. Root274]|uniref:M48 family metallopeptidase n=1 Tax=unclassified Rhizobium TaxID=2613769 RepID=UPI0007147121|nr:MULTISPECIES: M48 family metallopeptidase [unclassified Rhizobium]KQW31672.1 metalloprotease [Rhizobium sp. Root1240]KRD33213.1 metalloprotease [Rhizobium sp. Root274]
MASDDTRIAHGRWHPPGSSRSEPAVLLAQGKTLFVRLENQSGDPVSVNDLTRVEISTRVGRIPRRISFVDQSLFETEDNDAVDLWLKRHRRTGVVHELERFHPRLAAMVIAVALLAVLIYRFAVPALVEIAVVVTPPAVTQWMASGTLISLDKAVFSETKLPQARQDEIRAAFADIARVSVRGPDAYNLNFRGGGAIGPNAFALPDGTLVITDELVELADNDLDMITGVLAHEIGHVERDHSLRQLYRAAGTAGLIMLIAGDVGSAGEDILTNGAALMSLSYSRDAESEADRISVELMSKAGRDPRAIGRFFEKIEQKSGTKGDSSFLSTHPGTAERRKAIDDYAASIGADGR